MDILWVLLGIVLIFVLAIVQYFLDDAKTRKEIAQLEERNRYMEYLINCLQEAVSQEKEELYSILRCPIEVGCNGKGEEK